MSEELLVTVPVTVVVEGRVEVPWQLLHDRLGELAQRSGLTIDPEESVHLVIGAVTLAKPLPVAASGPDGGRPT